MAKLQTPSKAGFNAGKNIDIKMIPIADIKIDPEISNIFKISDKVLKEIQQKIEKFGYNEEEPIVIWKGRNILVDGRTRYTASKNARLQKIPAVEKEFENREAAILYTFERQVLRRNLTGSEILTAAQMIKGRKENDGTGRAAEILAEKLGVSPSTVYQARAILKDATPDELKAVKKGDKSIKKTYQEIKFRQNPDVYQDLPGNVSFLKSAVILLVENETYHGAAELLINHFLKKNEKFGFYKLLPETVVTKLPKLPLLAQDSN
jgi:ParB family chromosome partitioning protein